jgi:hypothetical protein
MFRRARGRVAVVSQWGRALVERQDPGSSAGVAIGAWRRYRAVDGPLQSALLSLYERTKGSEMVSTVERYAAAFLGFGFVAVALTAGLTTALLAGVGAVAAYGLVALRQRRRLDCFTEQFMDGVDRGRAVSRKQSRGRSRRAA